MSNMVGINGNIGSGKDTVADVFVAAGYCKISLADPMKRLAFQVFDFTEEQLWGPSDNRNAWDERYFKGSDAWDRAERQLFAESMPWLRDLLPITPESFLYNAQKSLIGWFWDLREHHPDLSPRVCLQLLGTEWGRETCNEDVWVDYMNRTACKLLERYDVGYPSQSYDRLFGLHIGDTDTQPIGVVVPDVRFENELYFFKRNNCPVIKVVRPETDSDATKIGVAQHKSETEQAGFDPSLFSIVIENVGTLDELLETADFLSKAYSNEGCDAKSD